MTKRITKTSVIQLRHSTDARTTPAQDRLIMAERKAREAWACGGAKRARLAQDALAISEDCSDAYMALATASGDWQVRVKLFGQAVAAAQRVLGPDWEKEYKNNFWTATETRPLMRAMANLANALRWEDELDEAADIYRQLMKMHPTDSQGIRYELASCLLESHQFDELDELLDRCKDDFAAAYLYTRALYLFSQNGDSDEANTALRDAFKQNGHVALYLPGIMQTPSDKPSGFAAGSEEEAIAYAWDNGFLWLDMPGASKWLADMLQEDPLFATVERELLKDVLCELRSEAE